MATEQQNISREQSGIRSALLSACHDGDAPKAKAAIKALDPRDVNFIDYSYTPLSMAARFGHPEIVRILIRAGADPNWWDDFCEAKPLWVAVVCDVPRVAELLLKAGARPDDVNDTNEGRTPLIRVINSIPSGVAPGRFRYEVVELLLKYGADPFRVDRLGRSAFSIAADNGHSTLMDLIGQYCPEKVMDYWLEKNVAT